MSCFSLLNPRCNRSIECRHYQVFDEVKGVNAIILGLGQINKSTFVALDQLGIDDIDLRGKRSQPFAGR